MRKKSSALLIALLLLLSSGLSGCGIENFLPADMSGQKTEIAEAPTTISFSWWGNDKRHEYTMNGVRIFEEQNPSIRVKKTYGVWQGFEQRTRVAMESHTEADVMQINYAWVDLYSHNGDGYYDLYSLSDYIDLSNYSDSDLQYGIKNGKLNAIPIAFNVYEFFYNDAIWSKYGLEFPKTWDEVFEAAALMREDGIYPFGFIKKQALNLAITWFEQTHGKYVFTEDGKLNISTDELGEMIEFYSRLYKEKVMIPIDDFSQAKFNDGEIAATMCWVSDAGNYCEALEKNGGIPKIAGYIIPEDAKLSGWYIKPATMYAISAYSEHPEEAAKLLNFLVNNPEMAALQMTEKGVPVSKSALETLKGIPGSENSYEFLASEFIKTNIDKLSVIKPIMENDEVIAAFKQYGDEYLYDQMTLEESAQGFYAAINEVINK